MHREIAQTSPKPKPKPPIVQRNMKVRIPGVVYAIDLDRQIGYKQEDASPLPDLDQSEVGKDTILGKPCKIVEIQHAFRIWYWGKIALKRELVQKVEGFRVEEFAIEIDENYAIGPDEFKIPASIKIQ